MRLKKNLSRRNKAEEQRKMAQLPAKTQRLSISRRKIFISFSFRARDRVEDLKRQIEASIGAGTCWICTEAVGVGKNLNREIAKAIGNADIVLCAINKDYVDSPECQKEVNLAQLYKKRCVPVLLDDVEWPLRESNGKPSPMAYTFSGVLYQAMYSEDTIADNLGNLIRTLKELIADTDGPDIQPLVTKGETQAATREVNLGNVPGSPVKTQPGSGPQQMVYQSEKSQDQSTEPPQKSTRLLAVSSLVISILAVCCCVNICCTIPAMIFACRSLRDKLNTEKAKLYAIASLVLSVISVVWSIILIVVIVTLVSSS